MTPQLHGLIPPIITPLTSAGELDVQSLRSMVDFVLHAGATGVFVLGSSGEAAYLADRDRRTVVEVAAAHLRGRAPLLVGALGESPNRVLQQIELFADQDVHAVVVSAPYYANLSDDEVISHFQFIAKRSALPVLAYDIPANTRRPLGSRILSRLVNDHTIVGVKDSSGDLDELGAIVASLTTGSRASILSGADTTARMALERGAHGLVAGLSNVRPDLFIDLLDAHKRGDGAMLAARQDTIVRLSELYGIGERHGLGRHASELGAMKSALVRSGVINTAALSVPLPAFPTAARDELEALLEGIE